MAQMKIPSCDVCGTEKDHNPAVGFYCPNTTCGNVIEPKPETLPEGAHAIKVSAESVMTVLQANTREASAALSKIEAVEVFGFFEDGTNRRIAGVMLQVKKPKVDRSPAPSRTTKNGVQLRLASREGVTL